MDNAPNKITNGEEAVKVLNQFHHRQAKWNVTQSIWLQGINQFGANVWLDTFEGIAIAQAYLNMDKSTILPKETESK